MYIVVGMRESIAIAVTLVTAFFEELRRRALSIDACVRVCRKAGSGKVRCWEIYVFFFSLWGGGLSFGIVMVGWIEERGSFLM